MLVTANNVQKITTSCGMSEGFPLSGTIAPCAVTKCVFSWKFTIALIPLVTQCSRGLSALTFRKPNH